MNLWKEVERKHPKFREVIRAGRPAFESFRTAVHLRRLDSYSGKRILVQRKNA